MDASLNVTSYFPTCRGWGEVAIVSRLGWCGGASYLQELWLYSYRNCVVGAHQKRDLISEDSVSLEPPLEIRLCVSQEVHHQGREETLGAVATYEANEEGGI